jgi:hypothetical protein
MNSEEDLNKAREFIRRHFIPSRIKQCRLHSRQLKYLLLYSSDVISISTAALERIMQELDYMRNPINGFYYMTLSLPLRKFAKESLFMID